MDGTSRQALGCLASECRLVVSVRAVRFVTLSRKFAYFLSQEESWGAVVVVAGAADGSG